jgi:hypothetical protein
LCHMLIVRWCSNFDQMRPEVNHEIDHPQGSVRRLA